MSFLYNNVTAIIVAAVAATVAWMFGGTRGGLLVPVVPWLLVIMLQFLLLYPQRHHDESLYDARERLWKSLKRDPVLWIALGLMVLLTIPFFNAGLCVICDAVKIAAGAKAEPPVKYLPFCVNTIDHLNVWFWFALSLTAMVVVRHALKSSGKVLALELIVWNGVALAILGFIQNAAEAPGPLWSSDSGLVNAKAGDFFSTFGYPNMAGDYFTSLFGVAVALWRHRVECCRQADQIQVKSSGKVTPFWHRHFFLMPAALFYFAALNTLSRAAIMLVTALAIIAFLHTYRSFMAKRPKAQRVRVGMLSALVMAVIVVVASLFTPENIQREVDSLNTSAVLDRVTGRGQYHVRVATEIWKDYPFFGCGGWGYLHFCIPKMTPEEYRHIQMIGGINVHNDYLQFLAEHGIVGFGAICVIVWLLLVPVGRAWKQMVKSVRFLKRHEQPPHPVQIFVMPAAVFLLLCTVIATLIHSFGDCPLRSPAVLMLFFMILASLPGFLPNDHSREES